MFLQRSDYDHGPNTFSPEGRLFQVEYATEAIKLGTTSIGIQTAEGVVLCVEKRISSPLLVPQSVKKISEVHKHIGVAFSGLTADARTLVDHARVACQNHWFTYDEPLSVESCAQSVCDLALGFGESGAKIMARPYGVALLIAGYDDREGPVLYHTDPSGSYTKFEAKAIGGGSEAAQTSLQEEYNKSMKLGEAERLGLQILKQVMEDKISPINVEVAAITTESKEYRVYSQDEVEAIISQLTDTHDI